MSAVTCTVISLHTSSLARSEDDSQARSTLDKKLREMENRVSDLGEDLEAERSSHNRTEKLKRDLQEVGWITAFFYRDCFFTGTV